MASRPSSSLTWATLLVAACVGSPPAPPSQGESSSSGPVATDATAPMESTTTSSLGTSSSGGASSSGSEETTASPAEMGTCQHRCRTFADCTIDGTGVGLSCTDGRCAPLESCTSDGQCVAELSAWADGAPCMLAADCEGSAAECIGVRGSGHCVATPTAMGGCLDGASAPIEVVDVEGVMVVVCGVVTARCGDDGLCFRACQDDMECTTAERPVCVLQTGRCGCGDDSHCAATDRPEATICIDGTCACANDMQCVEGAAGDVCRDGACGCTDDAACRFFDSPFDGGTIVCAM